MAGASRQLVAQQDYTGSLFAAIPAPAFHRLHAAVADLIGVAPSLAGLPRALDTLRAILPDLGLFLSEDKGDETRSITLWLDQIQAIPADSSFWHHDGFDFIKSVDSDSGMPYLAAPDYGILVDYPRWSLLLYQSETSEPAKEAAARKATYQRLQAAIHAACIRLSKPFDPTTQSQVAAACRFVRRLHSPRLGPHLDEFNNALKIDELRAVAQMKAARQRVAPTAKASKQPALDPAALAQLLGRAFANEPGSGPRSPRRSTQGVTRRVISGEGRLFPGYRTYEMLLPSPEPAVEGDPALPPTDVLAPAERTEQELIPAGIDPDEYARPATAWFDPSELADSRTLADGSVVTELPPIATTYGRARARQRAIKPSAQRLTTRRGRMTAPQLALILDILQTVYEIVSKNYHSQAAKGHVWPETARPFETLRLAAASLVTGTPIENMATLLAWPADLKSLPPDWRIAYSEHANAWLRPCLNPLRNPLVAKIRDPLPTPERPKIALADIWGVGRHFAQPSPGEVYFQSKLATHEQVFRDLIKPLFSAAGVDRRWQSLSGIAEVLPSWFLGREEGDQLRVAMIFNRPDPLASVHLYYTAIDPFVLNRWFSREMKTLWAHVCAAGFTPSRDGLFAYRKDASIDREAVGDDRMVKADSIRAVASELQNRLDRKDYDIESAVERHNNFTAYVAMYLAIVTGFRSIRTPIPDLGLVDGDTGFFPLQEKDQWDGSHARIVWIPVPLREQIRHYLNHLGLLSHGPAGQIPTSISIKARTFRDLSRFNTGAYTLQLDRTLFFLRLSGKTVKPEEFTGESLRRHLESICPGCWPVANAGRHFVRTALNHWGCPPTVINTLMGHWHLGEASWAPESYFDPYRFRDTLQPYLNNLLKVLQFEIIRK